VLEEVLSPRGHECRDRVTQVGCPIDRVARPFVQLGQAMAERGVVDALFGAVVEIGRPLGDVSALGDLLHRRAIEAVLAEHLNRGVQERISSILGDDVRFGWPVLRVSPHIDTTIDDLDVFAEALVAATAQV